jgi:hypothetical protein
VNSRVFVKLRSGRAVALVGVAQGYKVVWQEGETRDVVGDLNAALEASRSANPPERPQMLPTRPRLSDWAYWSSFALSADAVTSHGVCRRAAG